MIKNGWLDVAQKCTECSHFNDRPAGTDISLLVIHNISLPPAQFGKKYVEDFFCGNLNNVNDPFLKTIENLRVSSHLYIKRNGATLQFVSFEKRAWHAGVSCFQGLENCNDFSIGIELEGTDHIPYTDAQYFQLSKITELLQIHFPLITRDRIVGHQNIAPSRKSDPGPAFDWSRYKSSLIL